MTKWQERPLGDLIDLFDSRRVPLSAAQRRSRQGPYPYYGAQSVIDHIDDYIFDGRYILIPEDGENLNSRKLPIAYFAEGKFWVNNHAHVIKAKPGVAVDRFVQSALESTDISGYVTGAAQPKLSQANLLRIPVLDPGFEQQKLIGRVLDAIDDLIENNRRRVALLEQMAQAVYREWFVHFRYPGHETDVLVDSPLGPIPSEWSADVTGDLIKAGVIDIGDGYRAKNSELANAGLPFIRVANVRSGAVDFTDCDYLPLDYATRLGGKVSRAGDCVISMKGTVGRVAVLDERSPQSVYSPQVSYWRSLDSRLMQPSFLRSWMQSEQFTVQCARVKGATDMADYVNLKDQRSMSMLVPGPALQQTFADSVEPGFDLAANLRHQMAGLRQTRDLLLPKLVTGQIDVSKLDLGAVLEGAAG